MSNDFINREKEAYDNIDIPENLDLKVRESLKIARKKKNNRSIYKSLATAAIISGIFVVSVNVSPTIAQAVSSLPGLDKLVDLVRFSNEDKGLNDAVDEGLAQSIDFSEESSGIRLQVDTIAGDKQRLWIGYNIGADFLIDIRPTILSYDDNEEIQAMYSTSNFKNSNYSYLEIGVADYKSLPNKFIIKFDIYGDRSKASAYSKDYKIGKEDLEYAQHFKEDYITTFNVPIELDSNIFINNTIEIKLINNSIETEAGVLHFDNIEATTTRATMTFSLVSDKYDYNSFKNPKLIDDKGNEYPLSRSYLSSVEEKNRLEFQGKIDSGIKSLKFACDGMYYMPKNEKIIAVDLKNKEVSPNIYGLELVDLTSTSMTLQSSVIESISINDIIDDDGTIIVNTKGISFTSNDNDTKTTNIYFEFNNLDRDILGLEVYWVLNDITKPFTLELYSK